MSKLKDHLISLVDFINEEHGHHTDGYMKEELDSDICPAYHYLMSDNLDDVELIKIALEEDDSLLLNWAKANEISEVERHSLELMIQRV